MHNQPLFTSRTITAFFLALILLPSTLLAQSVPQIFWIDESGTSIKRANPDGSNAEVLVKDLYYAESIAIDPVKERIYWCDEGPQETFKQEAIYPISSIAIDGSGQIESLPVDYAYCDQDILIDDGGHIYFSGTSEEIDVDDQDSFIPTYSRTDLEGKNEQLILYDNFEYIYGLAGSHIYFGDKQNHRLNLDTGGIEDVLSELEPLGDVVDDREKGRMYFNTYFNIYHSNYDGSDLVKLLDVDGAYNLGIDERAREVYWDTEGFINKADLEGRSSTTIIQEYPIDLAFYNPPVTPPSIVSNPVTEVTFGSSYSYEVEAIGTPDPTFSLDNAPQGMEIDAQTGVISWTPSEPGFASVTVRATNGVQPDATQSYRITVSGTAPVITSTPETTFLLGENYTYNIEATGNPAPTFALDNAPEGMEIDAATGVVSWTPTEPGFASVTVRATNGVDPDDTQAFRITVTGTAPTFTSTPVTTLMLGETYLYEATATGNPVPTYALDTAPEGMEINSTTGAISWTPDALGNFDVVVSASNGVSPDATQSFTIDVTGTAPAIISQPITTLMLGEDYAYDVNATGNPAPTFALETAPEGMEFNATTGEIFWSPTALGSFDVLVIASNGVAPDATQSFTIEVTGTAPTITSTPVTTVMLGETYTYDVNANGNPTPTFALDTSPEGMEFNTTTGVITWTPTALGSVDVAVSASNGVAPDATQSFTIEVTGTAPAITSTPVTTIMLGESYVYDVIATGNPSPTFSLTEAPEGMEINPTTGGISWVPSGLGSFDVVFAASNGVAPDATQSFTIEVTGTAPAITSTPVTTVMLGEAYAYDVNATGNPTPTYSLGAAPDGMEIDALTGGITWTAAELGSFDVLVIASNGVTPDATQSFTIEVAGAEPTITSAPVTSVMLGEMYAYDVEATGNPAPSFALDVSPEGMEIDAATGEISWATSALGSFDVTVRASNGIQPDATQSFTLTVEGTSPAITSTPITTVMLGETYTYNVEATGNPTPTLALGTAPEGMEIDATTGIISWTPTALGSFDVIVTASNSVTPNAIQSFSVEVIGTEPTITSTPVTTVMLGESYVYDVVATGNPAPTFALGTAPEGMEINETTGGISWIPTALGSVEVVVIVSNGVYPDATQSFTLTVVGAEPTITSAAITTVMLGETYTYDVEATGNPTPTFALDTAPEGMAIDETTGAISWTPGALGSVDVVVSASNGVSPDATQSFTITVTGAEPAITSTAVTTAMLDEAYTYDVEATGNPTPTFALDTAPEGMTIDEATGIISWTPGTLGDFDVVVSASNGVSPDATQSFTITVGGAEPMITSTAVTTVIFGEAYTYDVEATGNPVPTFALDTAPEGMAIDAATGVISWTPTAPGSFDVVVSASNGVSPDATQSFTITVTGAEPAITSTPVTSGAVGETYSYDVDATGNPAPTYSLAESPEDMTIDPETGFITWVPTAAGDFSVTVMASNGVLPVATQAYTINVVQLIAPAITSTPELVATVGMPYEYTVQATGNPVPTFALTEGPEEMTLDAETGLISWTPVQDGDFSVTVTATNGVEPEAIQSFTITVMLASNTDVEESLAQEFQLDQNFPNPFAASTTIAYNLPLPDHVKLNVYDMLGRHIKDLVDSQQTSGAHRIEWDGRDQQGSTLPAGVYFVRIQTQSGVQEVLTMTKVD